MAREILVALKSEDRLSQMIPYIQKIAQSGMRVVFLLRFSPQPALTVSRHDSIEARPLEGEWEKTRFPKESIGGTVSMEEQRLSAEHKVFLALEALRKRGVEITVDVYTGSLRRAMKRYTCKGDVHLIVMRRRRELMDCINKAFPLFGLFKHATFTPVLVLHPTHAV